ncbi:SET domain [Trypanosoma melophagium]|uniref:SET domain n=1 Tax=Trypanosoma melophagium TaxID=715481 RepID=UPI00351A0A9D|nr:SET domain [Trypanosoma melophagium]
MPVYENRHLLRVLLSPQEQAKHFVEYCRSHHVLTRGLCRIGTITRGGGNMRGLIANKDIRKDENIVMLSVRACLHPARALKNKTFFSIFPPNEANKYFLQKHFVENSRVADRSIIRHNQFLLACYMTYLILRNDMREGEEALKYIQFMPRSEGDFEQLISNINGSLDGAEVCRIGQSAMASHFGVSQAEIRPLLQWSLAMIFSRMAPMDHRWILRHAFSETPFENSFDITGGTDDKTLVKEPIAFLCPVIDICNHSEHENVALMVPEQTPTSHEPIICLRSLRDIEKGEELTMTYGGSPTELRVIWGMQKVF